MKIPDPTCFKEDIVDFVELPDFEFNLWTKPDAAGTPFENGNRTWFYFSVRGPLASKSMKLNIMNLNRQGRLYSQGLSPFFRTSCGKNSHWQRIKSKVCFANEAKDFRISFLHRFADITKMSTTYFAFCYPYSYAECQLELIHLEETYCEKGDLSTYNDSGMSISYGDLYLGFLIEILKILIVLIKFQY